MSKHRDKKGTDHLLKLLREASSKGNLIKLLMLCRSYLRSLALSIEFKNLIESMAAVSNNIQIVFKFIKIKANFSENQ